LFHKEIAPYFLIHHQMFPFGQDLFTTGSIAGALQ